MKNGVLVDIKNFLKIEQKEDTKEYNIEKNF